MAVANKIKGIVSKNKRRFQEDGFDLDLTYICQNIIAMGFPAEKIEGVYRNNINDVVRFLDTKHWEHYKVYNLCSERSYDQSRFHNRVQCYPFDDHHPPPFELLGVFCADVDQWIAKHPSNVVVVHCKAGKGRTGVMVCAYLLHRHKYSTAEQALRFYGETRTRNKEGVTIPSQIRYVDYYSRLLRRGGVYQPTPLVLLTIRLVHPFAPAILPSSFNNPFFIIRHPRVKHYQSSMFEGFDKSNLFVDLPLDKPIVVCGDFVVEFYSKLKMKMKNKLFHLWINSFFVVNAVHMKVTLQNNSPSSSPPLHPSSSSSLPASSHLQPSSTLHPSIPPNNSASNFSSSYLTQDTEAECATKTTPTLLTTSANTTATTTSANTTATTTATTTLATTTTTLLTPTQTPTTITTKATTSEAVDTTTHTSIYFQDVPLSCSPNEQQLHGISNKINNNNKDKNVNNNDKKLNNVDKLKNNNIATHTVGNIALTNATTNNSITTNTTIINRNDDDDDDVDDYNNKYGKEITSSKRKNRIAQEFMNNGFWNESNAVSVLHQPNIAHDQQKQQFNNSQQQNQPQLQLLSQQQRHIHQLQQQSSKSNLPADKAAVDQEPMSFNDKVKSFFSSTKQLYSRQDSYEAYKPLEHHDHHDNNRHGNTHYGNQHNRRFAFLGRWRNKAQTCMKNQRQDMKRELSVSWKSKRAESSSSDTVVCLTKSDENRVSLPDNSFEDKKEHVDLSRFRTHHLTDPDFGQLSGWNIVSSTSSLFTATNDVEPVESSNIVFACDDTPLTSRGSPTLSTAVLASDNTIKAGDISEPSQPHPNDVFDFSNFDAPVYFSEPGGNLPGSNLIEDATFLSCVETNKKFKNKTDWFAQNKQTDWFAQNKQNTKAQKQKTNNNRMNNGGNKRIRDESFLTLSDDVYDALRPSSQGHNFKVVTLSKRELDRANKDVENKMFPADFQVQLFFAETTQMRQQSQDQHTCQMNTCQMNTCDCDSDVDDVDDDCFKDDDDD